MASAREGMSGNLIGEGINGRKNCDTGTRTLSSRGMTFSAHGFNAVEM